MVVFARQKVIYEPNYLFTFCSKTNSLPTIWLNLHHNFLSMQFLTVENASKSYGEKSLFRNVTFSVSKGDRIALIAKNGSGKTTLLKIIAALEGVEGENAKIAINKNIRTAFLTQDPDLHPTAMVIDEILESNHPVVNAVKLYRHAMESGDETALQKAMSHMDTYHAWDAEAQLEVVLNHLKIDHLENTINTLSGGQKKRVALAKVILSQPDFLILDEPTNHLDIEMIEWLEDYLKNSGVTLFMVTHDRYFLDNICNEIFELDHSDLFVYRGSYTAYLEKKDARLQNEAANLDKSKKLFRRELEWMRRMPQARTTKAKSRIDDFHELKDDIAGKTYSKDELSMQIDVTRLGSKIVELHNISKKYGEKTLFSNFTYKFKKGERVGVVGRNGAGKSTFIKVMTGETPTDTGKVVVGETVVFGHYNQDGLDFTNDKTIIDTIRDIAEYIPLAKGLKLSAESLLERFLFPRSQQRVFVSQLSDFLKAYSGGLLIVSHDRYFMDKLVDHIFILEGDGNIRDYNGNYTEYRMEKANAKQAEEKPQATVIKTAGRNDFELRKEIKSIEKQIEKLEKRKQELTAYFDDPNLPVEKITQYSTELAAVNTELSAKEEQWLELSAEVE